MPDDVLVDVRVLLVKLVEIIALGIKNLNVHIGNGIVERRAGIGLDLLLPMANEVVEQLTGVDIFASGVVTNVVERHLRHPLAYQLVGFLTSEMVIEIRELRMTDYYRQRKSLSLLTLLSLKSITLSSTCKDND